MRELGDFRCLMLDWPGWGLTSPIRYAKHVYKTVVANLLAGVPPPSMERANVAGAAIGDIWALRLVARHPARVGRIVLLGEGPLLAEVRFRAS